MTPGPSKLLAITREFAREAGRIAMAALNKAEVHEKAGGDGRDLVTDADRQIEAFLTTRVFDAFPRHQIFGEEEGLVSRVESPEPVTWLIDPIDGTFNYAAGLPTFAVSIGVCVHGVPQVGVIELPGLGEQYYATRGGGAFCNDNPIEADRACTAATGLVDVGGKYLFETFTHLGDTGFDRRLLRIMGCAALACAFVASGRLGAFVHASLSPWDLAAGALIAEEAGGRATDFGGAALFPKCVEPFLRGDNEKCTCIVSAPQVHEDMMGLVKGFA